MKRNCRRIETGDVNLFLDTWHSSTVSVNKGSMEIVSKTDAYPRFEAYFAETKFVQYEDVKTPIVEVSLDGTLGWVSVEVHAKGERPAQQAGDTQTFEFTSAWVSLFRKSIMSGSSLETRQVFKSKRRLAVQ